MGQIENLRLFVAVVESGSISKAADKLRIAKSAVSRRLGLLEERYDTRLIDRAPGVWKISATGREIYQRAVRVVGDVDEIEDDFASASANPEGPLSVSVPREFGIEFLNSSLIAFKLRHPQIQFTVDFDDRRVDLTRENYDFAIRITSENESGVTATRIGTVQHQLYASPAYLADNPHPENLSDLHDHQLLYFGSARRAVWDFVSAKGKPMVFEFQPFVNSNSGVFLLNAVQNGLGIARLPDFILADALATSELVRVLPEIAVPVWGIYLAHSDDRRLNRRMRLFTEEMKETCISSGGR